MAVTPSPLPQYRRADGQCGARATLRPRSRTDRASGGVAYGPIPDLLLGFRRNYTTGPRSDLRNRVLGRHSATRTRGDESAPRRSFRLRSGDRRMNTRRKSPNAPFACGSVRTTYFSV